MGPKTATPKAESSGWRSWHRSICSDCTEAHRWLIDAQQRLGLGRSIPPAEASIRYKKQVTSVRSRLEYACKAITRTASIIAAVAEAMPDIRCIKFRATLSATSKDRALPRTVPKPVPAATLSPSFAVHSTRRLPSTAPKTCSKQRPASDTEV